MDSLVIFMYALGMLGHENLDGIISFPPLSTPIGSIRFGGILSGAGGTGFNWFRTYEMYALVLILGTGRYRDSRGCDQRLEPGHLMMVFPDVPHQYGPEQGDTWNEMFISFDGEAFEGWRAHGLDPSRPVRPVAPLDAWCDRFRSLLQMRVETRPQACAAVGAIHALIADALAADPKDRNSGDDWLEFACQALGRGAGAPSLEEIARTAGLSYENFRKRFRLLTGESPARYRKRRRLTQAALMLQRADLSLEIISRSLGFCDAFHLSKDFKAQYGLSPSAARQRNQKRE